jgi:hypothetical protein
MAQELRLDAERVLERLRFFAEELPGQVADVEMRMRVDGLEHTLIDRLAENLISRAATVRKPIK